MTPMQTMTPPALDAEALVLGAFRTEQRHLSVGQLRIRTALPTGELRTTLRDLVARGELRGLNTVVEAYTLRAERTGDER
jgi:hypothetical protein